MVLTSIALGISIGTSSVIARSVGQQSQSKSSVDDDVQRLGTHSLILVSVAMSVLATICWFSLDHLFLALGANQKMLPLIHSYLDIYLPGSIFFTTSMILGSIMRANGSAMAPGVIMTVGSLVHLLLDPILIFGWFGFPAMELSGAATAMTLTRFGTLIVILVLVFKRRMVLDTDHFRAFFASSKRILHVGIPAIATNLIGPVTAAYITRLMANYGETAVAGFGVAGRIESVAAMLMFALSGSIGPFVGQNLGAKRLDRVRQGVKASYKFSLIWGFAVALPLFVFGEAISGLIDSSPEVIAIAALYLALVPWSYGCWGMLMMATASFNAVGKPLPSTALSFARMVIVYIPLASVLDHYFSYQGIFIATLISNTLFGVAAYYWFRSQLLTMSQAYA
ncbi:MAG TPA: MATE family efflux transporter [Porticoccaceae bacterium]|nr:MATE family efflux transporter [Porticoccaceae bacterium]